MIEQRICAICREDTREPSVCGGDHGWCCVKNCWLCINELRDEGW